MKLTNSERLALLVALEKQIKPALDDAKDFERQSLLDANSDDGTDRRAIMVGGVKVGTVGVSYSKPAPHIMADRMHDAIMFLAERGLTEVSPVKGWESHFTCVAGNVVCTDTGETVDWATWEPACAKSASVRGCDPDDVMAAFGGRLSEVTPTMLLEGGV